MTPRRYFQAGSIPVCVIGGLLSLAMGFAPLVIPFALLAGAFTLALIWGE